MQASHRIHGNAIVNLSYIVKTKATCMTLFAQAHSQIPEYINIFGKWCNMYCTIASILSTEATGIHAAHVL